MPRGENSNNTGIRRPSVDPRAERQDEPVLAGNHAERQGRSVSSEKEEPARVDRDVRRNHSVANGKASNVVFLFPGVERPARDEKAGAPHRLGGVRSDIVK